MALRQRHSALENEVIQMPCGCLGTKTMKIGITRGQSKDTIQYVFIPLTTSVSDGARYCVRDEN